MWYCIQPINVYRLHWSLRNRLRYYFRGFQWSSPHNSQQEPINSCRWLFTSSRTLQAGSDREIAQLSSESAEVLGFCFSIYTPSWYLIWEQSHSKPLWISQRLPRNTRPTERWLFVKLSWSKSVADSSLKQGLIHLEDSCLAFNDMLAIPHNLSLSASTRCRGRSQANPRSADEKATY